MIRYQFKSLLMAWAVLFVMAGPAMAELLPQSSDHPFDAGPEMGPPLLPHSLSGRPLVLDAPVAAHSVFEAIELKNLHDFVGARTAPNAPKLEDYFQWTEVRDISMAPDGRHLAVVKRQTRTDYAVYILDMERGGDVSFVIPEPRARLIVSVEWLTESRLGVTVLGALRYGNVIVPYLRMLAINADGSNPVGLLADNRALRGNLDLSSISSILPLDSNHVQMMAYDRSVNLYKVNLHTGEGTIAYRGGQNTVGFITDIHGNAKMRIDFFPRSKNVRIYRYMGDRNRWELISKVKLDGFQEELSNLLSSSSRVEEVAMVARRDGDEFAKLYAYNIKTKEFTGTLFERPDYDIRATISNPWSGELLGATYIDDRPVHYYFNPGIQSVQSMLETAFPNGTVRIGTISNDDRRYLFFNEEPWRPGTFYIYDKALNQAQQIVEINPVIGRVATTSVDILQYQTADGLNISGYLTYPHGRQDEALPLIVFPHGGAFCS